MVELYDKDGTLVADALTKEEAEAAQATAIEAAKAEAIETYKKENPAPAQETPEEKTAREAKEKEAEGQKTPAELAKEAADTAVAAALRARDVQDLAKTYAPGDAAKQAEIVANFGKLTGFEATPEGLTGQAEAAARLAGIDTAGVDISGVAGTGAGRNVDIGKPVQTTEADDVVRKALGITQEDVTKYSTEVKEGAGGEQK